ncbi:MAG TPA: PfkB family carbohydrate kinase, partial [Acidobacteriota bacterium]|nr:PfkB family carbohydrate kinase [Acidobacteriota bacterium]
LRSLRKYSDGFLAMTCGHEGAMALLGDNCVSFPALRVNAVDTTGAGDIFHGAFLYGLIENWPLNRIMAFANTAAGLSCLYLGAQEGIRPRAEILGQMAPLIVR